jgi:hypothetical protein
VAAVRGGLTEYESGPGEGVRGLRHNGQGAPSDTVRPASRPFRFRWLALSTTSSGRKGEAFAAFD